jgi:hypothetical protein
MKTYKIKALTITLGLFGITSLSAQQWVDIPSTTHIRNNNAGSTVIGANTLPAGLSYTPKLYVYSGNTTGYGGVLFDVPTAPFYQGDGTARFHFNRANTNFENFISFESGNTYKWLMGMDNEVGDNFYIFRYSNKILTMKQDGTTIFSSNNTTDRLTIKNDGVIHFNGAGGSTSASTGPANGLPYGTSYLGFNTTRNPANGNWTKYTDGANNGSSVIWGTIGGWLCFSPMSSVNGASNGTVTDATVNTNTTMKIRWNDNLTGTHKGQVMIGEKTITSGAHADFKLSVDGKILATEIYVTQQNWADYVFEKDYKLLSLPELEKYIATNKHLPNVPSTAEMKSAGNNVANTDQILLEKIEELTLYVIEQQKHIESLKKEIDIIKK